MEIESVHIPRHSIDAKRARGNPYWYNKRNNSDNIVAEKRLSSTLTSDDRLEILHRSLSPLDSRYYYYYRRYYIRYRLTVEQQKIRRLTERQIAGNPLENVQFVIKCNKKKKKKYVQPKIDEQYSIEYVLKIYL